METEESTAIRNTLYPALDRRFDERRSECAVREISQTFDAPTKPKKNNA